MSQACRTVMADGPLRLVVVGAGGMGRAWLETIARSSEAVLAGVADLDLAAAQAAADAYVGGDRHGRRRGGPPQRRPRRRRRDR
ncbi:MAG TPA: hypothetical protein VIE19_06135, partial [Lapillicoccus sp.]